MCCRDTSADKGLVIPGPMHCRPAGKTASQVNEGVSSDQAKFHNYLIFNVIPHAQTVITGILR